MQFIALPLSFILVLFVVAAMTGFGHDHNNGHSHFTDSTSHNTID